MFIWIICIFWTCWSPSNACLVQWLGHTPQCGCSQCLQYKALAKVSTDSPAIVIQTLCPCWINLTAWVGSLLLFGPYTGIQATGYEFSAFICFMDVQAALCSGAVLSVNIYKNMQNMQNMQDIEFLLFIKDIADCCNSQSIWDTNFHAC